MYSVFLHHMSEMRNAYKFFYRETWREETTWKT